MVSFLSICLRLLDSDGAAVLGRINVSVPVGEQWMDEGFYYVHDLVKDGHNAGLIGDLDPSVIPAGNPSRSASREGLFQTPAMSSFTKPVEAVGKSPTPSNFVDGYRRKEVVVDVPPLKVCSSHL